MKIILLQDIPRIGVKGDIKDLAPAYALNSFINKGLARIATIKDEQIKKQKEENRKNKKEEELDKSIVIFKRLEKEVLIFKKKVDSKGHLYAKLSKQEIVDSIFAKEKISINDKQVNMREINTLGTHNVEIVVGVKKYNLVVKIEN